jgi:hypothetical protein
MRDSWFELFTIVWCGAWKHVISMILFKTGTESNLFDLLKVWSLSTNRIALLQTVLIYLFHIEGL